MKGRWRYLLVWRTNGAARVAVALAMVALVVGAVLGTGALRTSATPGGSQAPRRVTLRGHLVPALAQHTPLHATDRSQGLDLAISLSPRDSSALDALIAAQNDSTSPLYHHFLTTQQYVDRFAPTQVSVDQVTSFLHAQGLVVHDVSANRGIIHTSGSVASIEQAFGTQISDFALGNRTVYAPTLDPSLPAGVAGLVTGIVGLDDAGVLHHSDVHSVHPSGTTVGTAPHAGSGPYGSLTPTDMRMAYDATSLVNAANGAGQTVALVEFDSYSAGDVNTYLSTYGLGSAKYSNHIVDGASTTPGVNAFEVEMDMEIVSGVAPGANQWIYIAPNSGQGELDLYNKIVSDNVAKVTSASWALCESYSGNPHLQALDNIFRQGAAQGQAFFASSGDNGAFSCYPQDHQTNLNVNAPASDPHVVGVGGTTLVTNSGATYNNEYVWNWNDAAHGNQIVGGGGGYSGYFSKPSYQTGPGVSGTWRIVPDVSADADPDTGYAVYCSVSGANYCTGWTSGGGTSASAPFWAALTTDTNQYLINSGMPTEGTVSAALYHLFNSSGSCTPFHDITVSNNLYYNATTGFDPATGIGTPDAWCIAQLLAIPSPHFSLNQSAFGATSAPGTNPASQKLTIKNTGVGPLVWSSAGVPSWLTLSPASGSIPMGSSADVTLSFNTSGYTTPQTLGATITLNGAHADTVPQVPVTVVLANVSKQWYFAEGDTAGSFQTYLSIANPNPATANVQIQYFLDDGTTVTKNATIAPNSRLTPKVNNDVGTGHAVSMTVTSDIGVVAERPMYFTYHGIPGGTDVLGATALSATFSFGYVDTTANHTTFFTILNPNAGPTNAMDAQLTLYPAAGGTPITFTKTVPASSRGTIGVNAEVPGLPAGSYSATISLVQHGTTTPLNGLVERPMYLIDSASGYTGSADVIGVSGTQTTWYFAEGATGSSFFERYILSNPCLPEAAGGCGATPTANATVTFFKPDGSTATATAALTAGQQKVINVNDPSVLGQGVSNSAKVTSDHPILAERFMSFVYHGIPGATDVLGATAPSSLFVFAEGSTSSTFTEFLTIENPNTQAATVTVTFLPAGGVSFTRAYTVAANSRFTLRANDVVPNGSFSLAVESNQPIVAERPMYFAFYGTDTGGSDIVGYQP